MAIYGNDSLTDRAVRVDVHAAERSGERRRHLFLARNDRNPDIWKIRVRLGMSHSRSSGSMLLDFEKGRINSQAVSFAAISLRPVDRRPLYVRVADGRARVDQTERVAAVSCIH